MSCCTTGVADVARAEAESGRQAAGDAREPVDVTPYVQADAQGRHTLALMVEGIHCGGCVKTIERELSAMDGVESARVNMTTRRLQVVWQGAVEQGGEMVRRLAGLGYRAVPYDPQRLSDDDTRQEKELLRAMAVAGFAAANVMLLSVSVWAGHAQGMADVTRDLLHWFSALIALPAIVYAGRPFYRSALSALKAGRMNMDVPISLAVLLAGGMSLSETIQSGPHAYFDSAVTLLFFLLLGRYLDRRARGKARSAAERLLALRSGAVTLLDADGSRRVVPADQLQPGMRILAAAGERIAADGRIVDGTSELDSSLLTGETLPHAAQPGSRVYSGTLNLSAPVTVEVTAVGEDTLLSEIVRLMETAEQRRAKYVALADRMARGYAPVVHVLALAAFLGWVILGGLAWQPALLIAVAVLIVTCPCALGLAVPAVQVIASGRLLKRGVLLKSGTALERLAKVDTVVFDKTGTLTLGRPELKETDVDPLDLRAAAGLAGASTHPLARALSRAAPDMPVLDGVREEPGCGLAWADAQGNETRLGKRSWVGADAAAEDDDHDGPELWLTRPGMAPVRFTFDDPLRSDAGEVVRTLQGQGKEVVLLSGDRTPTVEKVAGALGLADWQAECAPAQKVARLEKLVAGGKRVLMVGDGLNDAPALAAASVSLSPASAADISQTAADAVFQGERLAPVLEVLEVARRAGRLVHQNFGLAFAYNAVAVPLAMAGFVTPLIAAVVMSASSLAVTGNSLRLGLTRATTE
ncbi:heavy metal translocating P-type ATPase [Rhodovibrio salinarum]|uniref:Copper-translocating P-type ATPase n=1 Tax=Rhodovibrio salinarum TaxID=1087 RepID=A0A934QKK5_9PROT|nr:heavy metal translocating P-type ATPase [Rhodovibrio salinarum]MBK1698616.1 copper-translocating P-type ATPase [Rhodovibrio salinarum]